MMNDPYRNVVVVGGLRTPFVKADTAFKDLDAVDLGRAVVTELLEVYDLRGHEVDAVIMGNIAQPVDAPNLSRVIALEAGLSAETPAHTVNRNCASGMESIVEAARLVALGEANLVIAGGTESMTQIPLLYPESYRRILFGLMRSKTPAAKAKQLTAVRPAHFKPVIALQCGLTDPVVELNMGETAEVLAKEFGITRDEQDQFALLSHQRAIGAQRSGRLDEEIAPVYVPPFDRVQRLDNGPRENQTMEALGKLRPMFDRQFGTVTAGNACPITDGAAAVLVADSELARARGWTVLGRIRSHAAAGIEPERMGLGPVVATSRALDRAGMTLRDLDLIEINEAFAAQVLACGRAFASNEFAQRRLARDRALGELPMDRLNVNGGAIALGHPVGVSGTRLVLTMLLELKRRGLERGLASLCVGGGQGMSIIVENAQK